MTHVDEYIEPPEYVIRTDRDLEEYLFDLLHGEDKATEWLMTNIARVERFGDAGLLTRDKGVVIAIGRDEWQVSIVRSGRDRREYDRPVVGYAEGIDDEEHDEHVREREEMEDQ